jgi:hypothetical protein
VGGAYSGVLPAEEKSRTGDGQLAALAFAVDKEAAAAY